MAEIVIAVIANAGGVGKSTLATHLGYEIAKKKIGVNLVDLDSNCTLDVLAGLNPAKLEESTVQLFSEDFQEWYLTKPDWKVKNLTICQGHLGMSDIEKVLAKQRRSHYMLKKRLKSHPNKDGVIILDCPASLGIVCENAIAAATHIIIPVEMEVKSISGAVKLLEWSQVVIQDLELDPAPKILGVVPSIYNEAKAQQRKYLEELPELFTPLGVKVYPAVRDSVEFSNASGVGLPLHEYRPKHRATKDFREVTKEIVDLIGRK